MFTEKLSRKDISNYVQEVICGDDCKVIGDINKKIVEDENGKFDYLCLDFWVKEKDADKKMHCLQWVSDYEEGNEHIRFFIKKFGLPYVLGYKQYLETLSLNEEQKAEKLKEANDFYYDYMFNIGQQTLTKYENKQLEK